MIKVLDKSVADRIAAGEVVDRPLSVVKELVENSIDAGAGTIVVEIKGGGKNYIRVTDDGCGIPAEEVQTAFLRHATSKIEHDSDLNRISTLGFRGEALASIAAVSRLEILTKPTKQSMGCKLLLHGGEVMQSEPCGCPDGTTIIVNDLFYNTPARLKFMKADNVEASMIIDFVSQMALAYPKIRFRMTSGGNILFSTTGRGNLYETIQTIYSKSLSSELVPVDYESDYLHINGYVSAPMDSKTSRRNQIFFVNGRVVSSKVIEKGVNSAYSDRMFEGRYPTCFLFVELPPDKLDVNIHPNKRDVRFNDEAFVSESVANAIVRALDSKNAIFGIDATKMYNTEKLNQGVDSLRSESPKLSEINKLFALTQKAKLNTEKQEQVNITNLLSSMRENAEVASNIPHENTDALSTGSIFDGENENAENAAGSTESGDFKDILKAATAPQTVTTEGGYGGLDATARPKVIPFKFEDLIPLGSIFGTYVMAVDGDTFYLIDQHAAHERCFFEKLLKEFKESEKPVQPIMVPIVVTVRPAIEELRDNWMNTLTEMGFDIEPFGPNTYAVRGIPVFMSLLEATDFVEAFLENYVDRIDMSDYGKLNQIITKSCKSAVKGNNTLHMEEIKALLLELSRCNNPYSCPHGRPTFVKFTRYELEKFFKRIQ